VLAAWSHAGRCRDDGAFAMLAGTAPIPASSGKTERHRLNRSGDRQLNRAIYIVVVTRLRLDPATRAYAERRRAQGKSDREIRRCLSANSPASSTDSSNRHPSPLLTRHRSVPLEVPWIPGRILVIVATLLFRSAPERR
jgi:hypothetical protein